MAMPFHCSGKPTPPAVPPFCSHGMHLTRTLPEVTKLTWKSY